MKFVIVLVALFGLSLAAPSPKGLKDDMKDFLGLLPLEKMKETSQRYLNTDAEVQRVVAYLQGPEWAKLVAAVGAKPAWIQFKEYLTAAGMPVDKIIEIIHNALQNAKPQSDVPSARGVREYVDEIKALIPNVELLKMLDDKLTNSPDFIEFWKEISDDEAHQLFDEVRAMEEVQRLATILREMGIDLDKVIEVIYILLGWA